MPDSLRGAEILLEQRIVMPDSVKEPSRLAKVLAIGPKVRDVKVGDTLLTPRYGGMLGKAASGEVFFFMKESEIQGVIHGS